MPPEGYDTVTLPVGVVERLDDLGSELNNPSRASVILMLLDAYDEDTSDTEDVTNARVVDMDATEREKLAREVAGVLQG